jgi:succinate dehydrogenase / fumarate reductase flavoprotein subunit
MTKMGVRTDRWCRSDLPGLLVAGLAQAGCANHFAGFHIGMCIGTGWIAGRSAIEDLDRLPAPALNVAEVQALHDDTYAERDDLAAAESDRILRDLQTIMFAYDVMVWKHGDRLKDALSKVRSLKTEAAELAAPHMHELVRLKETDAMLLAAEIMLEASLYRNESRMSHFREDYDFRDDANWLCWIDVHEEKGVPKLTKTPIPTPLCPIQSGARKSVRRVVTGAAD